MEAGVYTVRSEAEFKALLKKMFMEDLQGKCNTVFFTQIGIINVLEVPAPIIQFP